MEKAELANFPPTVRARRSVQLSGLDLKFSDLLAERNSALLTPWSHISNTETSGALKSCCQKRSKKFMTPSMPSRTFLPSLRPNTEERDEKVSAEDVFLGSFVRAGHLQQHVVLLKSLCPEYSITDPEEIGELDEEERRQCIDLMPKGKRYVLKSALDAICAPPADPEADRRKKRRTKRRTMKGNRQKESSSIKNAAWGGSTSEADQDDEGKAEEKPQGKKGNALWGKLKKRASVITRLTPKKNKGEDEAAEEEKEEPNSPTEEDTEELKKQAFNERLTAYYSEKNPDKVAEVPKMVNKFFGREDSLFKVLVKKYGESSREDGVTPGGRAVPIDARMVRPVGAKSDKELKDEEMKKAAAEEDRKARAGFGQAKKPGSALGAQSEQGPKRGRPMRPTW